VSSLVRSVAASCLFAPLSLAGQSPDSSAHGASTTISGYLTTSYTAATRNVGGVIVGRLYGRNQDQFMVNVADIVFERVAATDRWDAGVHLEPTFGTDAAVVKSAGLDLGADADIWQAYVTLNLPYSKRSYFQVKAGKMATLMGVEAFQDVQNPTLEVGNQDIFLEPFTETGAELDGKFGAKLDAELRISNGWDLVVDDNRAKSFTLRLGIAPDAATTIALTGYTGPEQAGNTDHARRGADLVASRQFGSVTAWLQLDYGQEADAAATGDNARWSAIGAWLRANLSPKSALGFRADYLDDRDGARTSGVLGFPVNRGQTLTSLTGTLTLKYWPRALVRPEVRYDRSTLPVFDGHTDQLSLAVGFSVLF
jgi:hypothetical protein